VIISVAEAARQLEEQGLLERYPKNQAERVINRVTEIVGQELPSELKAFYREHIANIGRDASAYLPIWNDWPGIGWHGTDWSISLLLDARAVPIFSDGSGNYYGVDLIGKGPTSAVYFFDAERSLEKPAFAAGSSIGRFLLLLAKLDQAFDEKWPERWELEIDPDIDKCTRARAIWNAG
jgi:hypothetical protein